MKAVVHEESKKKKAPVLRTLPPTWERSQEIKIEVMYGLFRVECPVGHTAI